MGAEERHRHLVHRARFAVHIGHQEEGPLGIGQLSLRPAATASCASTRAMPSCAKASGVPRPQVAGELVQHQDLG